MKIGIVGQGYVGTAIKVGFESYYDLETYDKYSEEKSTMQLADMVESCEVIFVCVPTPMNKDGSCNIDIIDKQVKFPTTKTSSLTSTLLSHLLNIQGISLTGHPDNRLPNSISLIICSKNNIPISGRMLVRELSNYGIFVSSGSACSSARKNSSGVLEAINIDKKLIKSSLRISLGSWLTELDSDYITNTISNTIEKIALIK